MKSISTINPSVKENMDGTIVKAYAPVIDIQVGVSHLHSVSLHFVLLSGLLTFGYHSKQKIMLQASC